ncbi:hypothetical protein EON81_02530 [bacterium]|nr:MAG: hypothetical protein EON81_02530 [bacterium]
MALPSRARMLAPMLAFFGLLASVASAGSLVDWGGPVVDRDLKAIVNIADPVALDCGSEHTLVLKSDGTVAAWGKDYSGSTMVPLDLPTATKVAAGGYHSMALQSNGTVRAWGLNDDGQTSVPAGLTGVIDVAGGLRHSLAAKSNGTVVAWGANDVGQASVPAGLTGVVQVSGGSVHSLALKSNGTVVAWGFNSSGQCTVPAGLSNVVSISAGSFCSVAVKSDGTVVAWGSNANGQIDVPPGLTGFVKVSAGDDRVLALRSDGTVAAWGQNFKGQTTPPAGLHGVTDIAAGGYQDQSFPSWAIGKAFTVQLERRNLYEHDATVGLVDIGDPAPAGGATVALSLTNDLGVGIELPTTITIPAGETRRTFPVSTGLFFNTINGSYKATYGSRTAQRTVSLTGGRMIAKGNKVAIYPGSTTDFRIKLELTVPPIEDFSCEITTNTPSLHPKTITFTAGQTVADVPIEHSIISHNLTGYVIVKYKTQQIAGVGVDLEAFRPTLGITTGNIPKGESATATVGIGMFTREPAVVAVSTNNANAVTVPTSVTVPAGARQVSFPVQGVQGGSARIYVTYNGLTARVDVKVIGPALASVELPASIPGQRYFNGVVHLDSPASAGGMVVNFSSSNPVLRPAAIVTIPAGASSATFSIVSSDVAVATNATITATAEGVSATATTSVKPLTIKSFTLALATVKGGVSTDAIVTLNETVGVNTLVTVESADPSVVIVPSSTTVVKGGSARTFTVKTKAVTVAKFVKITVTKNGTSTYRTLKVTP